MVTKIRTANMFSTKAISKMYCFNNFNKLSHNCYVNRNIVGYTTYTTVKRDLKKSFIIFCADGAKRLKNGQLTTIIRYERYVWARFLTGDYRTLEKMDPVFPR